MDVCRLQTGWEPWLILQCRHRGFGDFGSISAYLPPSAESSCSAGMSSTWPGEARQARHCAKGLCLTGAQGELRGSGWILGMGHSRFLDGSTAALPPPQSGLQNQAEPDMQGPYEKKADWPDTRQADLRGCPFLPVLQSGARALPSLGKQKLWALLLVDAACAVRLVLEVPGNDVFKMHQITFSLALPLLGREECRVMIIIIALPDYICAWLPPATLSTVL